MHFWGKLWQFAADNRASVAIGLGLSIFMAIWTVGTDLFTLVRPGPVTATEENTGRTADAAEEIATTLRTAEESPRRRLVSAGYELTRASFRQAIEIGDTVAVADFCSIPGVTLFSSSGFFRTRSERPQETLELLGNCPAFDIETECKWDGVFPNPASYRLSEVEVVCGRAARVRFETDATKAQEALQAERQTACQSAQADYRAMVEAARNDFEIVAARQEIDRRHPGLMAPLDFRDGCRLLGIDLF